MPLTSGAVTSCIYAPDDPCNESSSCRGTNNSGHSFSA